MFVRASENIHKIAFFEWRLIFASKGRNKSKKEQIRWLKGTINSLKNRLED